MAVERPSTPPALRSINPAASPVTPEQVKQLEIARLKAKALREQRETSPSHRKNAASTITTTSSRNDRANLMVAGQKRPASAISTSSSSIPPTLRDARSSTPANSTTTKGQDGKPAAFRPLDSIQPARNFSKFVEYDLSKMSDTKGGFMSAEDDPHNRALHSHPSEENNKPSHMTLKEWERLQLLRKLRETRSGPFEPSISILDDKNGVNGGGGGGKSVQRTCRECGDLEIDFLWSDHLHCNVCTSCKEKYPEQYSLLTKTEAKADYLLTDPELRDSDLLPHLTRPNPHKSSWNDMMLFLRYQVEEYAFSDRKWGSGEALDAEFERREAEKRGRKERKFKEGLRELKRKTRVEAWRRRGRGEGGGGAGFGEEVGGGNGRHEHTWGRPVTGDDGSEVKRCTECGMEVEELEF